METILTVKDVVENDEKSQLESLTERYNISYLTVEKLNKLKSIVDEKLSF